MGRLFWKFFFFIWLAQLSTIVGISSMVWLKNRAAEERVTEIATNPLAVFAVGSAAATLQFGGPEALRRLLQDKGGDGPHRSLDVLALDEAGHELLNRPVPGKLAADARVMLEEDEGPRAAQQVRAADGHSYLLFVQRMPRPEGRPPRHDHQLFPIEPMAAGVLASLIFAALLARYFSRPIRGLRGAFEAAATGDLTVRAAPMMGKRRDELADLGRDFDTMADRLRALMDAQRRLLHDVSHEMRSPLARMQAAIGLSRQQPEKIPATLVRVEREVERIDSLVGELLTLARLDAGVGAAKPEELSVDGLTADIADDARFEAQAVGRDVAFEGGAEAIVEGNPELLLRAIENVIRNAVKHTAPGTTVTVRSTLVPETRQWRLEVLDHGPGVPADQLETIFEPFFRGADGSADGHGLGLAIARRVVQTHGGTIRAFNRDPGADEGVSSGLRVEIMLPLKAV
jgi:two-component system OmpR family sensor kinase